MKTLVNFLKDEQGLETVEWVVMASLIVIGIVLAATTLGDKIASSLGYLTGKIKDSD